MGSSYSTIQTDSGNISTTQAEQILKVVGSNDISTIGVEGSPDTLTIDGSNLLPLNGGRALTGDLDINNNDLNNVNVIKFITSPTHVHTEGAIHWNEDDKTLNIDTEVDDTQIQVGQEVVIRATNKTGSTITNGSVVYVNGAQGQRPTIALADADSSISSDSTIGIATHDISNNQTGYITTFGLVRNLDTSLYSEGDTLYLSSVAGNFTNIVPVSPQHTIKLGIIVYSHAIEGSIFVRVDTGGHLSELHDVDISGVTDGQALLYNNATSLWEPNDPVDLTANYIWTGNHEFQDDVNITGTFHTSDVFNEGNQFESRRRRTVLEANGYYYETPLGIKIVTPAAVGSDVIKYKFTFSDVIGIPGSSEGWLLVYRHPSGGYYDQVSGFTAGFSFPFSSIITGRDASNNTIIYIEPANIKKAKFRITEIDGCNLSTDVSNVVNLINDPTVTFTTSSGITVASNYPTVFRNMYSESHPHGTLSFGSTKTYVNHTITQLTGDSQTYTYQVKLPDVFKGLSTPVRGIFDFELTDTNQGVGSLRVELAWRESTKTITTFGAHWIGEIFTPIPDVTFGWDINGYSYLQFGDGVNGFASVKIFLKEVFLSGYGTTKITSQSFTISYNSSPTTLTTSQTANLQVTNSNFYMDIENDLYGVGNMYLDQGIYTASGIMDTLEVTEYIDGGWLTVSGEMSSNSIRLGSTVNFYTGTGSPEGSITANPGSLYTNQVGGAGLTLYVKESGTGNTGWVAK
jgi:hypothetical protein